MDKSTVSREKRHNSTANGKYVWVKAQVKAGRRKRRTPGNRRIPDTLRWRVTELIKDEQWSPRQISGRLLRDGIHISHETIYRHMGYVCEKSCEEQSASPSIRLLSEMKNSMLQRIE